MGNYNRGDNYGGNRGGGRDRGGRGGDRERPQMHQATCAECGNRCEVPFRPSGDKPVYCSICFEDKGGSENRRDRGGRNGGRSNDRPSYDREEKKMFPAVCDKCHADCEVPFKPSSDKPIFCNDCFGNNERGGRSANASPRGGSSSASHSNHEKQFEVLGEKLDSIIKLLSRDSSAIEVAKEENPKAKKAEKKEKVEKTEKKEVEKKEVETKKEAPKKSAKKSVAKKKAAAPKKVAKKDSKKATAKKKK